MEQLSENKNTQNTGFSFKKEERLCSKKTIDKLFTEGETFLAYPVKIVFLKTQHPGIFPVKAGFSVGKRNFKKAVQRNLIKRKMREAYRLNKPELYKKLGENQLAVFFIFIGKTVPEYAVVEAGVKKGIKKLIQVVSDKN